MKKYDIVKRLSSIYNSNLENVDRINSTKRLIEEFEENFKIIPKEEWGVIYNSCDAGRTVTGGFSSEAEAKRFAKEWYEKQDQYIEEELLKNPDADISCSTYLTVGKIEPLKKEYLEWFKFDNELNNEK